jgi:DNA polymerase-3 subunit epsilon
METMKLKLQRPIAFVDIEGTGTKPDEDRIVEISVCILNPDLSRTVHTRRVNPTIPIPPAATAIHGISDEDVAGLPTFSEVAGKLLLHLEGCDIAGYNSNRYDFPLLYSEFLRAGIEWDYTQHRLIDVGNIFMIKEPRTLSAACRFYCDKELDGAHGAEADINATVDVFLAQYNRYADLPTTIEELQIYSNHGRKILDLSGKFTYNDTGDIVFNFGKYRNERAAEHLDFVEWMYYKASFQPDTNEVCRQLLGLSSVFYI